MSYAILRGDKFVGTTSTGLPRWTDLKFFASILLFPTREGAEEWMERSTMEFDDACVVVEIKWTGGTGT